MISECHLERDLIRNSQVLKVLSVVSHSPMEQAVFLSEGRVVVTHDALHQIIDID